jgi:hypothetical protein
VAVIAALLIVSSACAVWCQAVRLAALRGDDLESVVLSLRSDMTIPEA